MLSGSTTVDLVAALTDSIGDIMIYSDTIVNMYQHFMQQVLIWVFEWVMSQRQIS